MADPHQLSLAPERVAATPPRPSPTAARIKRIIVVPSRAMMDQVGTALAEHSKKSPPEASGFSATVPLERYDESIVIQISERLYDLAPSEQRKGNRVEDLPWIPTKFETKLAANISWDRRGLDKLIDIIRAGADVVDLTEANSTAAHSLEDFMLFDASIPQIYRAKIDFDDDVKEINATIKSATLKELDMGAAQARRVRSQIDYTYAVNLNAMARGRLRTANYRLEKDVDLNVSMVASVIVAALARQNERLAALRTPMRWVPLVMARHGNAVLPFNILPLPPDTITYNDALTIVDQLAGDVVIDAIEYRDELLQPPRAHTLPSLYLELEQAEPAAWTPEKLRAALASLSRKGCITNPWRTAPRYGAWAPGRIHWVAKKLADLRPEIAELAAMVPDGARLEGDNPRIVALTPLGRPYDEAEPLPNMALLEVVRRWVAHLLGPATVRYTRYTGRIGNNRIATEVRSIIHPGWQRTISGKPDNTAAATIPIGTRLQTVECRVHAYEGPVPEQYRIGTLLEDLLDPARLVWEPELSEAMSGATLASPEHILNIVERQLAANVIRRDQNSGWIDLSANGRALFDVFPTQLRHPAWVLGLRNEFRKAGGNTDRLQTLKAFAYHHLGLMMDDMRKRVPKTSGTWRTHTRQELR